MGPGLGERRAQMVLLVRAFEEADREGRLLPDYARTAATRRALMVTGLARWTGDLGGAPHVRDGEVFVRRARLLFEPIARNVPALFRVLRVAQLGAGTAPAVVASGLLLGVAAEMIPPRHAVPVLPLALVAVVAWNLFAYGAIIARIAGLRRSRNGLLARRLASLFLRGAIWRRLHGWRLSHVREPEVTRIVDRAVVRFGALWHRLAAPLLETRVRRTLHLGAAAVACGVVLALDLGADVLDYGALWPRWVRGAPLVELARPLLAPLAALTGATLPDGDSVVAARPWVVAHACVAGLVVVLPRLALAALDGWRSMRMATSLPVDIEDPYFRRMFAAWRGSNSDVIIAAYDLVPSPGATGALKRLLHDYLGGRADVRLETTVARGGGPGRLLAGVGPPRDSGRQTYLVALFDPTRRPTGEGEGAYLDALKAGVTAIEGRLVVILDRAAGGARRPPAVATEEGAAEAWRALLAARGLAAVELDLAHAMPDNVTFDAVDRMMWPPERPAA